MPAVPGICERNALDMYQECEKLVLLLVLRAKSLARPCYRNTELINGTKATVHAARNSPCFSSLPTIMCPGYS